MTCCMVVLYIQEIGGTNDILPNAILRYTEKIGSKIMCANEQTAVTCCSSFPQSLEKVEMQNSNMKLNNLILPCSY